MKDSLSQCSNHAWKRRQDYNSELHISSRKRLTAARHGVAYGARDRRSGRPGLANRQIQQLRNLRRCRRRCCSSANARARARRPPSYSTTGAGVVRQDGVRTQQAEDGGRSGTCQHLTRALSAVACERAGARQVDDVEGLVCIAGPQGRAAHRAAPAPVVVYDGGRRRG